MTFATLPSHTGIRGLASSELRNPFVTNTNPYRHFVVFIALASTVGAAQNPPLDTRVKTLNTIFSDYWEDLLKHEPDFASSIGDNRYNDQLSDYSVQAYNESLARGRAFLTRLTEVDAAGMSDQEQLSKDLLVRQLIQNQQEARFKPWEMPVNQFYGLQVDLPQLVAQLTFNSVKDYDDYIARLKKVPLAFQQITDDMSIGMEDHREPPAYLMEKVLGQVNTIANEKPQDSPFALPVKKFPASVSATQQARIKEELFAVIACQVTPAYVRFGKFLQAQYIPNGRNDPGIWSLPDGDAYYRFLVKQSTTTDLTPDQIHQIGLDQVKQDEEQILAIAQKLGFADIKALEAAAANNPKLYPTSKDQLLDAYRGYLDRMRPKLPQLFGRLPKAPLVVTPVPDYEEKDQAAAYYEHGTPDGSRPGTVFVNTYKFETRPLVFAESIAYHEGLPGHHLQISIAQELTGVPAVSQIPTTPLTPRDGDFTPSSWARMSASTRTRTTTLAAWKTTSGARSVWWSIPASIRSTGPASKWSITSISTRLSARPMCKPKSIATLRGRRRRWDTR